MRCIAAYVAATLPVCWRCVAVGDCGIFMGCGAGQPWSKPRATDTPPHLMQAVRAGRILAESGDLALSW